MIRFVEEKDIGLWIELAKEVEVLFGPMVKEETFIQALFNCIYEKEAICIENDTKQIVGFAAISREKNEIEWLAVKKAHRGKGYGKKLLERVLNELNDEKAIYVETFSSDIKAGEDARKLYLKFGFKDYKEAGKNPAGIDTVIMVRSK